MTERPYFNHVIVVPRIKVQNANTISSPLTHGFPAMSAFTGLMWALERKTQAAGLDLFFHAVGVIAHDYDELTTDDAYAKAFRLTRNPIGKDGKTAAIVEEGRMHMCVSLVFAVQSEALDDDQQSPIIAKQIKQFIETMRVAGGSVLPSPAYRKYQAFTLPITRDGEEPKQYFAKLKQRILPGFTLVERSDVLQARLKKMQLHSPNTTSLDAWLSLSRINWQWQSDEKTPEKGEWQHNRKSIGWVVPIPVGYGSLTEIQAAGSVENARDQNTEFRMVESLYSIGQWVSPHRLSHITQLLWHANYQPANGVYRLSNDYASNFNTNIPASELTEA